MSKFKEHHTRFASLCRSFGNPTRVAIIEKMAGEHDCIKDEIVAVNHIAESTVIEHLRSLRHEGLIKGNLTRQKMSYCINWEKLDEFKALFDQLYEQVNQHRENVICNKGNCIEYGIG